MRRTVREAISDRVSLTAAGCAFWATLSLFPSITMLMFLYGLLFDPATVEPQLDLLEQFLPPAAFDLISERVQQLVAQHQGTLRIGLLISTGFAAWSSAMGTKSILAALNMAYGQPERRSYLRFQLIAYALTLCAFVGAVIALAVLVFLPAAIHFLGLSHYAGVLARIAGFAVLVIFSLFGLSMLYRFGPARRPAAWHWVTPGSVLATALLMPASALFTVYVNDLANYEATYGPLSAVAAIMMWFWVTIYAVLLGGELNAELELQTVHGTTTDRKRSMARRGAAVADPKAHD